MFLKVVLAIFLVTAAIDHLISRIDEMREECNDRDGDFSFEILYAALFDVTIKTECDLPNGNVEEELLVVRVNFPPPNTSAEVDPGT